MDILFYGKDCEYWCFSNFSFHPVWLDGKRWNTNEHFYQAQKYFGVNPERVENIRIVDSPGQAKKMGNAKTIPIRPDWNDVKDDVMRRVCLVKAVTHKDVFDMLMGTGDSEIIENSGARDAYWGNGADGNGKNMLGKVWMEIRAFMLSKGLSSVMNEDSLIAQTERTADAWAIKHAPIMKSLYAR